MDLDPRALDVLDVGSMDRNSIAAISSVTFLSGFS